MKDKIVEDLIKKFNDRSELGIKKYGTTLEQNNTDDFLKHLQEELMDATLYIEKLKSQKDSMEIIKDFAKKEISSLLISIQEKIGKKKHFEVVIRPKFYERDDESLVIANYEADILIKKI